MSGTASAARRRAIAVLGGLALAASATLMQATPATAASGGLEVSVNGGSYGQTASGSVFTVLGHMVPGDAQQGQFSIRNTSHLPGFVRIVMSNVTVSDPAYSDALTISAAAGGTQGPATPVSLAQPCWVLTQGQVLPPGASLVVAAEAKLGQLDGTQGQGASAHIDFGISLSESDPVGLSPDNCGAVDVAIPALPTTGTGGGGAIIITPGNGAGPATGGVIPDSELPVLSPPGAIGIDPNTWHLYEEYYILIPIGSAILGAIAWWMLWGRRRAAGEEEDAAA